MEQKENKKRKWPYFLIGAILLCLIIGGAVWAVLAGNEYQVDITLKGDAQVTLEFGDDFSDSGAEAVGYGTVLQKEPVSLEIETDGQVDMDRVGTYTITYIASYQGVKQSVTRTVTVVDKVVPEITLVSDPEHFTLPGQEYQEEGFSATDNYDGDITDRVERKVEGDQVIYSVEDSSGNKTEVIRAIVYRDPEGPTLVLKGEPTITINAGAAWTEPGFTSVDNVDGDLTAKVVVSGKVQNHIAGTYELTYTVTDSFGNVTTTKRTVIVQAVRQPDVVNPSGKVIYLTFDDGPGNYTEKLLGILKKYNVKATFFVCKTNRLDLLDDIVKDGHSIGIHSATHNYGKIYSSEDAFFKELYEMQDIIYQHTGVKTTLLRFPGGSSNSTSKKYNTGIMTRLTKAVESQGFQYFDWNVLSGDAIETESTAQVIKNVIEGIKNNKKDFSVVLQHDPEGFSVDAVEQIIQWGLNNGYTFLPLEPDSPVCHHKVVN